MNNSELQDKEEERMLTDFLKLCRVNGELRPKENGQIPDAIIIDDGKKLGIEIVELLNKERKRIGSQKELKKTLQRMLQEKIEYPIQVQILFKNKDEIRAVDKEGISKKIVEIILNRIDQFQFISDTEELTIDTSDMNIGIVKLFIRIGWYNGKQWLKNSRVIIPSAGWVITKFEEELKDTINKKNQKYESYIENVDECWLLVFSNVSSPEGYFEFSEEMAKIHYGSIFKRAFFFEYGNNRYYELA